MISRRLVLLWLFFAAAFVAARPVLAQQKKFTVISYNVLEGFRNDTALKTVFVEWIKPKAPDLVFFQEMNKFTQKQLEALALRYGHPYAVLSKEAGYPVAITSRYPIVNVQKVVDNMWHAYISASVHGFDIFAIHFSPHQYRKRQFEAEQILYQASLLSRKSKVIIAGDFNSYSAKDSALYTPAVLTKYRENEQKMPHIRNLNSNTFDFSVIGAIEKAGFVDSYWKLHGTEKKPYKTRIDYIFLSANLARKVLRSEFIYDDVTKTLSDHRPVVMELIFD